MLCVIVYSLTLCEHVGEGNFGIVYRARLLHDHGRYSTVAVKMLKGCIFLSRLSQPYWLFYCDCRQLLMSMSMSMSKTFIGGAVCREFESEAPAAEEMLDWVVCSSEQFCFQMCLECGDGSGTFSRWRQRIPDRMAKAFMWISISFKTA